MAWLASRARATHVNPFCTPEEAEAVVELAQEFGDFHQQNDVGAVLVNGTGIGEGIPTAECPADGKPPHLGWVLNNDQDEWILPRRYDAMVGGQHTNNWNRPRDVRNPTGFRETYAYGDAHSLEFFHPKAPGGGAAPDREVHPAGAEDLPRQAHRRVQRRVLQRAHPRPGGRHAFRCA